MTRNVSIALLLAGVSGVALASTASAQTAAAQGGQAAGQQVTEVVVTGSRVITNGNNSPTPVTVVPVDEVLRMQPTTVAEALNTLPVFSGSRGQLSNPNSGTASQNGGGNSAGNFLNLRNMGAVRTLILFDGHRVPSTNVSGVVDVDMIPQQLLQRVDVVTGGASAVYGSDAVTGVVNFVTDRNFNGFKANAQYGVTQIGDDRSYNFGFAAGRGLLDGRAHLEVSYEFRNDDGIPWRSSRDPSHKVWSVQGAGTAANPYYLVAGARASNTSFGGLILCPNNINSVANCASTPLGGQTFNSNGVLSPFQHGAVSGTNNIEIGGDGIWYDTSMKASARSHQAFGRLDYDFTDKVHGYVEAAFNDKLNGVYTTWINLNNLTFSATDPYLAAAYQTQLGGTGKTFRMIKSLFDAPRNRVTATERQVFVNAGLEGQFGDNYKWDLGFIHSTAQLVQSNNNINNGKLYAALDAVKDSAGNIVCSVAVTNPGLYPGCVPLNPFGPTSDSPDAVAYFWNRTSFTAHTQMDDASGSLGGAPFSTWAGPVNVAVSGEWRKISYNGVSDALPTDLLSCTGLRFNCTATSTTWNSTVANRSTVSQTVSEGALEADAPLLRDKPFVQSLNLNGAVRYTSYSTSGNYTTWKVGVDWHVNDQVRLRGTRSRDIRAPTLDDLYSPTSSNVGNFPDNLVNVTATNVTTVSGGNPNLTAEQGDTWTGGAVFKPSFLPGFSLALDYFNIKVTNAILQLLAMNATFQKACYDSGGSSPYCSLQVRPLGFTNTSLANIPTTVYNRQINIAEQDTNGVDIEANYATRIFDRPGSIRLLTTYQPQILYLQPTVPTLNQAGAAFGTNGIQAAPVWRNTVFLRYSPFENFNIDAETRWRTSLRLSGDPTHVISSGRIPPATFTNLRLAYQFKGELGQTEVFLNISNLFDAEAPPAGFYGGQGGPGQQTPYVTYDDPLGRAFTFGVRFKH
jgi:outer membrane receptor protein involved in Fe transport